MRNLLILPSELVEQLEARVGPGQTLDDLVERVLAGDPATWRQPPPSVATTQPDTSGNAFVFCRCCDGKCRTSFRWRGLVRCGCPGADAKSMAGRPGIVHPDLDRE